MIHFSIKKTPKILITTSLIFLCESHSVYGYFFKQNNQLSHINKSVSFNHNEVKKEVEQVSIHDGDSDYKLNLYITNEQRDSGIVVSAADKENQPDIFLSGKGFVIEITQIPEKTHRNPSIAN